MSIEIAIRNGTIIDGTEKPKYQTSIGIVGGKIVEIGNDVGSSEIEICANNQCVAPGFVDIHSHSDTTVHQNPSLLSMVLQGWTTATAGNCGGSLFPVPLHSEENHQTVIRMLHAVRGTENLNIKWHTFLKYSEKMPESGIGMNLVSLVGHNILRACVMGLSNQEPTNKEMDRMKALLNECLEMGAWGMSTGLEYAPGCFSGEDELRKLCEVLALCGAFYTTHIRDENEDGFWTSLEEAVEISRQSKHRLHLSHLKLAGRGNWGQTDRLFEFLEKANKEGPPITWDVYPYAAWGESLKDLLPTDMINKSLTEILKDGESREKLDQKITQEMNRRGSSWSKIVIAYAPNSPDVAGKNIQEIADKNDEYVLDTFFRILLENDGNLKVEDQVETKIIGFEMNMEDVKKLLQHPDTIIATDGRGMTFEGSLSEGSPHPRYYGTGPRVLELARNGLFPVETAVRKMTAMPANVLGLKRGRIKVDAVADLVVFNPKTASSPATYDDPVQPPIGIEHVIINGVLVIEGGKHTGALVGEMLMPSLR